MIIQVSHGNSCMQGSSNWQCLLIHEKVRRVQWVGWSQSFIFDSKPKESTRHLLWIEAKVLRSHGWWTMVDVGFTDQILPHPLCMGIHPFIIDSCRIWYTCVLQESYRSSATVDGSLCLYDLSCVSRSVTELLTELFRGFISKCLKIIIWWMLGKQSVLVIHNKSRYCKSRICFKF